MNKTSFIIFENCYFKYLPNLNVYYGSIANKNVTTKFKNDFTFYTYKLLDIAI